MQNIQLYINDELADLSDDTNIDLTFQINNLAEVANQQGNTSKQFKLPLTQHNRRLLGYPDDMRFTGGQPYTQLKTKVVQNGIEIIPEGTGEINGVENDTVDFVVLSGNVDFFDRIGGNIYEMGDSESVWSNFGKNKVWAPYDHDWTVASIVASQNKTSGWIWPVVDYGHIHTSDFSQPINVRQMRPGFFLHTAIDLLAKSAGYEINPNSFLLKQPLYKKLIVQFANDNFEHGTDYQNKVDVNGMTAIAEQDQFITHYNIHNHSGILHFYNEISDPSQQFDGTTYTAKTLSRLKISLIIPRFKLQGMVTPTEDQTNVDIFINLHTAGGDVRLATFNYDLYQDWVRIQGSGGNILGYRNFGNQKITCEADVDEGEQISVGYQFSGRYSGPGGYGVANFTMFSKASLSIATQSVDVLYSQSVQCERILPEVSQKDFLKDTLQRFGITCQTDNLNKVITFASFRDIVNNIPLAKDWTSKCVNQGKKTVFQLGNYSQINWLRYQFDESIELNIMPKYFADDHIDIANTTINKSTQEADLFTSIFAPSPNRAWYGGSISQILKIDPESEGVDFSVSTKPRLLIDQKIDLREYNGVSVTFTDGAGENDRTVNSIVSVPYFYKPDGENIAWKDLPATGGEIIPGLRSKYYQELEEILKETKKIVRYFLLTPRDIMELDLLIPVYLEQDSAYFYINRIDNWRKGQPCKVELVRL